MDLAAAIAAVETASSTYVAAQSQLTNDQGMVAAKQAALDAATAQVGTDTQSVADSAGALNSALDGLIAAATAAKVNPTPTPVPTPEPVPVPNQ